MSRVPSYSAPPVYVLHAVTRSDVRRGHVRCRPAAAVPVLPGRQLLLRGRRVVLPAVRAGHSVPRRRRAVPAVLRQLRAAPVRSGPVRGLRIRPGRRARRRRVPLQPRTLRPIPRARDGRRRLRQ